RVARLGEAHQPRRALAHLADAPGRRGDLRAENRLDRVDDDRRRPQALGRVDYRVDLRLRIEVEVIRANTQPLGPQLDLLLRLLGRHVQHLRIGCRQPAGTLQQERRLPDARIATHQHERTRNYPAAEHPRELADWHGAAADLGAGDLGDRLGVAGRDAPLAAGPAIGRAGRALDRLYHRAPVAALRAAAVVSAAAVPALLAYIEAARLCHVATPSSRLVAAETKVGTRVAPPLDVDRMCPALSDRRDAGLRDDL